jgi:hypothetical protein
MKKSAVVENVLLNNIEKRYMYVAIMMMGNESKSRTESDAHKKTDEATCASSIHVNLLNYDLSRS